MTESLDSKIANIVDYAYHHSPATKNRFDSAGLQPSQIGSVSDLEKIPILRKEELLALQKAAPPFGGLLSVSPQSLQRVFVSP